MKRAHGSRGNTFFAMYIYIYMSVYDIIKRILGNEKIVEEDCEKQYNMIFFFSFSDHLLNRIVKDDRELEKKSLQDYFCLKRRRQTTVQCEKAAHNL